MRRFFSIVIGLSLLICASVHVVGHAKEESRLSPSEEVLFSDLNEVYIATKFKQKVSEAPGIVSVVTAQQIKDMGARNLSDVLNSLPGTYLSLPGQGDSGSNTFQYSRGIYEVFGRKIKLLLNGNSVNESIMNSWGVFQFYGTSFLDMVERIEVIRGPGSAVYGDEAFQGVINIITKSANGSEVHAASGNRDYLNGSVKFTRDLQKLNVNLMAGAHEEYPTEGTVGAGGVKSEKRRLFQRRDKSIYSNLTSNGFSLETSYMRGDIISPFTVNFAAASKDIPTEEYAENIMSCAKKSFHFDDLILNTKVLYKRVLYSFTENPSTLPGDPSPLWDRGIISKGDFWTDTWSGQLESLYSGIRNNEILAGVEVSNEHHPELMVGYNDQDHRKWTSYVGVRSRTRNLGSFYFQDSITILENRLAVNAGTRYDNYSDLGLGHFSPRVALVYNIVKDYTFKAMYGTAFRPPNIGSDWEAPLMPSWKGNPNLKPEKLETYEFGLDCMPLTDKLNVKVNYYNNRITDLIQFAPSDEAGKIWSANVGNQKSWGVEGETRYFFWKKNYIFANTGYLGKSENSDTGQKLAYMPEFLFNGGMKYDFGGGFSGLAKGFYRSRLEPAKDDTRKEIEAFWLFDATLNYDIKSSNIYLSVYNIFDQGWQDPSLVTLNLIDPIPGYGRRITLGYRFYF